MRWKKEMTDAWSDGFFASENQWKFNDRCDGDPFTIKKGGIFDWNGHFQFSSFGVQ